MASNSSIEWTGATWNPVVGCEAVSPGCANCYAATMTRRLEAMGQKDYTGLTTDKHFNGKVRCLPHKLDVPLKRKKPQTYFVNSMSDLFHEDVPDEFIDKVFAVMALCPQHTFQVLTKRAERMHHYMTAKDQNGSLAYHRITLTAADSLPNYPNPARRNFNLRVAQDGFWPMANVWLGASTEDQKRFDERWNWLRRTPAAVRFLSCEPLLGPLVFDNGWSVRTVPWSENGQAIHWVIVGGESGPGARPCDLTWIRSIVEQCKAVSVACFVKQLGAHPILDCPPDEQDEGQFRPDGSARYWTIGFVKDKKGGDPAEWPADLRIRQFPAPSPAGRGE